MATASWAWLIAFAIVVVIAAALIRPSRERRGLSSVSSRPEREPERALPSFAPPRYEDASEPSLTFESCALSDATFVDDSDSTELQPRFTLASAARTHCGLRRANNEDAHVCADEIGLFVVADGMGGEAGGEIASRLAIETLEAELSRSGPRPLGSVEVPRRIEDLLRGMATANRRIRQMARERKELRGMGTTLVALRFAPRKNRVYGVHVGDSRAYRFRANRLAALTHDQNLARIAGVRDQVGLRLACALGTDAMIQPDAFSEEPEVDDVYLLCSDGLSRPVSDERIAQILGEHLELADAAEALIAEANARGGPDNTTVVLVRIAPVI